MKGLSLTLEIVIIAIVLLVTALVILTIFGSQIAKVLGVVDPLTDTTLKQSNCRNACATWCMLNSDWKTKEGGKYAGGVPWDTVDTSKECSSVMTTAGAANCDCS